LLNLVGKRGGKHQGLPGALLGHGGGGDDPANLRNEAHVEHPVGLEKNKENIHS
jgi:hypothetical protein